MTGTVPSPNPSPAPTTRAQVTFVGTATLLLQLRRGDDTLTVLTDPVFDGPGTAQQLFGLPGLHYVARQAPALTPEQLPDTDHR